MPSSPDAAGVSAFEAGPGSLLTGSAFLGFDSAPEQALPPLLRAHYDSGGRQRLLDGTAGSSSSGRAQALSVRQASIDATLQPLQLLHRAACLQRLGSFFSGLPLGHSDSLLQAINRMESTVGRALAKAELAARSGTLPGVHLEVCLCDNPTLTLPSRLWFHTLCGLHSLLNTLTMLLTYLHAYV